MGKKRKPPSSGSNITEFKEMSLQSLGHSLRTVSNGAAEITLSLTRLISISLLTGRVSCDWKTAKVVLLFKAGKHDDMRDNYGPISLLSWCLTFLRRLSTINSLTA